MINTISQVQLSASQAERLSRYCASYRCSLVQHATPSTRRNQAIRAAQAMQARLYQCQAIHGTSLLLSQEEARTLRGIVVRLLRLQRTTPPCEQRSALIADLANVLVVLNRGRSFTRESRQP